jgi:hypothetical protein
MATAKMFRQMTSTMMREIQAAWLMESFQNPMTMEAAEISAQSVMALWYQLF